jgi:tetratricopeptide (TPR) repeat protein
MDEATQQLARAIELDPTFTVSYWLRAQIDESRGQFAEAIADYKKAAISTSPEVIQALIACVYARSGETAKAQDILKQLTARSQQTFLPSYFIADVHAMLGNKDEAIRLLEKAYDERSIPVGGAGIGGPIIDHRFDSLRSDPRFRKLLAKFSGDSK